MAKATARDRVAAAADELSAMGVAELTAWGKANGMDSRAGFAAYKKALLAIGVDYDALRDGRKAERHASLQGSVGGYVTLYTDAKARTDRFAICDRDGEPVWFGKFFSGDLDSFEQSSQEMAAAEKAVWLAAKIRETFGLRAIQLTLMVDAEWLVWANAVRHGETGGGKARRLGELALRSRVVLDVRHVPGVKNPADKFTVASGFKRWQDHDLRALLDTEAPLPDPSLDTELEPTEIEGTELEDDMARRPKADTNVETTRPAAADLIAQDEAENQQTDVEQAAADAHEENLDQEYPSDQQWLGRAQEFERQDFARFGWASINDRDSLLQKAKADAAEAEADGVTRGLKIASAYRLMELREWYAESDRDAYKAFCAETGYKESRLREFRRLYAQSPLMAAAKKWAEDNMDKLTFPWRAKIGVDFYLQAIRAMQIFEAEQGDTDEKFATVNDKMTPSAHKASTEGQKQLPVREAILQRALIAEAIARRNGEPAFFDKTFGGLSKFLVWIDTVPTEVADYIASTLSQFDGVDEKDWPQAHDNKLEAAWSWTQTTSARWDQRYGPNAKGPDKVFKDTKKAYVAASKILKDLGFKSSDLRTSTRTTKKMETLMTHLHDDMERDKLRTNVEAVQRYQTALERIAHEV